VHSFSFLLMHGQDGGALAARVMALFETAGFVRLSLV